MLVNVSLDERKQSEERDKRDETSRRERKKPDTVNESAKQSNVSLRERGEVDSVLLFQQ